MDVNDLELARAYCPHIMFDQAEPFPVKGIGVTVFRHSDQSASFPRSIHVEKGMACAIEYAVYFDYDIQHLYDLEHMWVYVGSDGRVCDAEASFHGCYMKSLLADIGNAPEGTHVWLYCQPGKHAFLPDGRLFRLLPDWDLCCNEQAGTSGLLVNDIFRDRLSTSPEIQRRVQQYIKTHFAFRPTLHFRYRPIDDGAFIPWEELHMAIPTWIRHELEIINQPV